mmetsp:Transcript_36818/g.57850  ORF Transcript_36818/g.57850 Transcript_36818/m.57850 type:complete len:266 (+) Transcript_36818:1201-1998(+)
MKGKWPKLPGERLKKNIKERRENGRKKKKLQQEGRRIGNGSRLRRRKRSRLGRSKKKTERRSREKRRQNGGSRRTIGKGWKKNKREREGNGRLKNSVLRKRGGDGRKSKRKWTRKNESRSRMMSSILSFYRKRLTKREKRETSKGSWGKLEKKTSKPSLKTLVVSVSPCSKRASLSRPSNPMMLLSSSPPAFLQFRTLLQIQMEEDLRTEGQEGTRRDLHIRCWFQERLIFCMQNVMQLLKGFGAKGIMHWRMSSLWRRDRTTIV